MCVMAAAVIGTIASAAIGAAGSLAQGKMAKQTADYNAAAAKQEGQRIRELGAVQEASDRRATEYQLGQQIADFAAAGRSPSTGTALELAYRSKLESELAHLSTRAGYQMRSEGKTAEAGLYKLQGRHALIGASFSAAGRILNGIPSLPALG
jgi:hypothetical protein